VSASFSQGIPLVTKDVKTKLIFQRLLGVVQRMVVFFIEVLGMGVMFDIVGLSNVLIFL